jgi:phage terminase small subunit
VSKPAKPGREVTRGSKKERFVQEYLIDLNGTQAAIRAGYSTKTANRIASELLSKPDVIDAIANAKAIRAERTEITADQIVKELARIAFADPRDVMSWGPDGVVLKDSNALTDDQARQVSEVSETTTGAGGTLKVKKHDKVKALELLGRHLGMFTDKLEHAGAGGGPLTVVVRKFSDA